MVVCVAAVVATIATAGTGGPAAAGAVSGTACGVFGAGTAASGAAAGTAVGTAAAMGAASGAVAGAAGAGAGAAVGAATGSAAATGVASTGAAVLSGPVGWAVLGANESTNYTWTFDCWRPILRDYTSTRSEGRLLREVCFDDRIKEVIIHDWCKLKCALPRLQIENLWGEKFLIDYLYLPSGQLAAHATMLTTSNSAYCLALLNERQKPSENADRIPIECRGFWFEKIITSLSFRIILSTSSNEAQNVMVAIVGGVLTTAAATASGAVVTSGVTGASIGAVLGTAASLLAPAASIASSSNIAMQSAAVAGSASAICGPIAAGTATGSQTYIGAMVASIAGAVSGASASALTAPAVTAGILSGPLGWTLLGANKKSNFILSYDCWKPIVHDCSSSPSRGIFLREIANDSRVKKVTVEDVSDEYKRSRLIVENIWDERFDIEFFKLPSVEMVFAHAIRV
ncbi:unnamed protein product [Toxocara canis]|uniref:Uncharacterized protein n=1 Tax=Toxocara canis TaxID=6265 RepID=A0A183V6Q8_TOXCA|nr:unnamed protein product [Toxocara canis]